MYLAQQRWMWGALEPPERCWRVFEFQRRLVWKLPVALPPPSLTCVLTMETFSPGVRGGLSFTEKKKKKVCVLPLSSRHYRKHARFSCSTLTAPHSLRSVFDCDGVDIWSHLLTMGAKNTPAPQLVMGLMFCIPLRGTFWLKQVNSSYTYHNFENVSHANQCFHPGLGCFFTDGTKTG